MEGKLGVVSHALVRALRYPVRFDPVAWVLPEGPVPQSVPHDEATERLRALIKAWARNLPRPVFVAHDLAIRFSEAHPKVGIDPDLCLLDPPPPNVGQLQSLALWKEGHAPPSLCLEIVSRGHPHKDYRDLPHRYAHVGAR